MFFSNSLKIMAAVDNKKDEADDAENPSRSQTDVLSED